MIEMNSTYQTNKLGLALATAAVTALAFLCGSAAADGSQNENPPALVNGEAVEWAELRDLLAETAGGAILEEVVIDRLLRRRLKREDMKLTQEKVDAELEQLLTILHEDRDRAVLALEGLRESRSLGDRRFKMLLERNAMLRMLIADQVEVTESMVVAEYNLRYGPKYRIRLITTANMTQAQRALDEIRSGLPFSEAAALYSTDGASANRGGLIDAVSPFDATYPLALRRLLGDLEEGEASPIFAVDASFAMVQLVKAMKASDVPLSQVRAQMERAARVAHERLLMENLARDLLRQAETVVLDPALSASWKARRGGQ